MIAYEFFFVCVKFRISFSFWAVFLSSRSILYNYEGRGVYFISALKIKEFIFFSKAIPSTVNSEMNCSCLHEKYVELFLHFS